MRYLPDVEVRMSLCGVHFIDPAFDYKMIVNACDFSGDLCGEGFQKDALPIC